MNAIVERHISVLMSYGQVRCKEINQDAEDSGTDERRSGAIRMGWQGFSRFLIPPNLSQPMIHIKSPTYLPPEGEIRWMRALFASCPFFILESAQNIRETWFDVGQVYCGVRSVHNCTTEHMSEQYHLGVFLCFDVSRVVCIHVGDGCG